MPPKKVTKENENREFPEEFTADDGETEIMTWYDIPNERKTKRSITLESHLARFDGLLDYLKTEIEKRSKAKEKGVRVLLSTRKIIKELRKETPYIAHKRKPRDPNLPRNTLSGFTQEYPISAELAAFLQIEDEEPRLSRLDATRAICTYAHLKEDEQREEMLKWAYLNPGGKRNLQNTKDKKAIVPDAALSKLLKYDEYKKQVKSGKVTKKVTVDKDTRRKEDVVVTSDLLYYWTIQKLLNQHFIKT